MNTFLVVSLALLFVLFMLPYLFRREPRFTLHRVVAALIFVVPLLNVGHVIANNIAALAEYRDWLVLCSTGVLLLLFNYIFSAIVDSISDGVEKRERLTHERNLLSEKKRHEDEVATQAEWRAKEIVQTRDNEEFDRLRREALQTRVESDLEASVRAAMQGEAYKAEQERLRKRTEGDDINQAIWIWLYGAEKVLDCELAADEVLAVPYWIEFQLNQPPRAVRFNRTVAQVKKLHEISFMAKRWSKVEGQVAVVADGALVYPPALR